MRKKLYMLHFLWKQNDTFHNCEKKCRNMYEQIKRNILCCNTNVTGQEGKLYSCAHPEHTHCHPPLFYKDPTPVTNMLQMAQVEHYNYNITSWEQYIHENNIARKSKEQRCICNIWSGKPLVLGDH